MLLFKDDDIELNPGPNTESYSYESANMSNVSDIIKHNFSLNHYNVQSAVQKIDILESELSNLNFIGLSETWFNRNINSSDIDISGFRIPFCKDRNDGHGGVAVYVKNDIPCARR